MAIKNTVSRIVIRVHKRSKRFRLPPVRYEIEAYFMVIEIVSSFLHKTLATIYLTCRRCPWACFNGNEAICCDVFMGMKATDSDLSHCDTLNLDEKYNCQQLKHIKFL